MNIGAVTVDQDDFMHMTDESDTDGSPKHITASCNKSLKRMGLTYFDIYYLHKSDPKVPIATSMLALKELQAAGKIKSIGLSEPTLEELKRAAKVCNLEYVQVEYSLFSRGIEKNGILRYCQEHNIQLVSYSPVARELLSNAMTAEHKFSKDDHRPSMVPYFNKENYQKNIKKRDLLIKMAALKGCTSAQLALRWVVAKGATPIPATKNVTHLRENLEAQDIPLSAGE